MKYIIFAALVIMVVMLYVTSIVLAIFLLCLDEPGFYPNTIFLYGSLIMLAIIPLAIIGMACKK